MGTVGRLFAALLYAGPGSALSHTTAAWWWRLLEATPTTIHVTAIGRRRSLPGIRMHRSKDPRMVIHRGLAVTGVERTLLDVASALPFDTLRRVLAEADHRRLCDVAGLEAVLQRGHPGSAALRRAVSRHLPELAHTLSVLEERFLALCERAGLPVPEVNARVGGLMVDMVWRDAGVIVELDGHAAHGTPAAIEEDRRRDLILRSLGYLVLRYTWAQVTRDPDRVISDLWGAFAARGARTPSHRVRRTDATGRG